MAKIILNEALQYGIQGVSRRKPIVGKRYQELVDEADKKIDEDHYRYARAYKKASSCIAR